MIQRGINIMSRTTRVIILALECFALNSHVQYNIGIGVNQVLSHRAFRKRFLSMASEVLSWKTGVSDGHDESKRENLQGGENGRKLFFLGLKGFGRRYKHI